MASFRKFTLKSGQVSWEARVHRRGAATVAQRFDTKAAAQAWARVIESDLDEGSKPPTRTTSDLTIAVAIDAYLEDRAVPTKQRGAFATVRHDLGTFAVRTIDRKKIRIWLAELAKTNVPPRSPGGSGRGRPYAASTRRKYFYALKSALEWHSRETGYSLPPDLFEGLDIPPAWQDDRDRRVSQDEVAALLANASSGGLGVPGEIWQRVIRLALETAMRVQEMILAEWRHLSPDGRILYVPPENDKTKQGRHVPLSPEAQYLIAEQRKTLAQGQPRIFAQIRQPSDVSEAFADIRTSAKIADLVFHDLRHEATSRICESGIFDLYEAMQITGHRQLSTFQRYARLLPSRLAEKMSRMQPANPAS